MLSTGSFLLGEFFFGGLKCPPREVLEGSSLSEFHLCSGNSSQASLSPADVLERRGSQNADKLQIIFSGNDFFFWC